ASRRYARRRPASSFCKAAMKRSRSFIAQAPCAAFIHLTVRRKVSDRANKIRESHRPSAFLLSRGVSLGRAYRSVSPPLLEAEGGFSSRSSLRRNAFAYFLGFVPNWPMKSPPGLPSLLPSSVLPAESMIAADRSTSWNG